MKKSLLFALLRSTTLILLGVLLVAAYNLVTNFTNSSQYIYSGQVKNDEYGFSFSMPEGWIAMEPNRSSINQAIVAQFTWVSPNVPDAYFDLFITKDAEPGIAGLTPLGSSARYHYFYAFERYPLECSAYNASTEYETRGRCEMVEDIWHAIENGVLPTFFIE